MFVRLKTGARAGEVHEMKFADAQPLLADGRAEQVYAEVAAPVNPKNGQTALKTAAQKKKGKKP